MAGANLQVVCADGCPAEGGNCEEGQSSSDKAITGFGLQTLSQCSRMASRCCRASADTKPMMLRSAVREAFASSAY